MSETYTPQIMHHPHFAPAICNRPPPAGKPFDPAIHSNESRPARFPPLTVKTREQEEEARAKGYLLPGEVAPHVDGYFEYPKMMQHPDHVPAVEAEHIAEKLEDGTIKTSVIPGRPAKFPHVFVKDLAEEEAWTAKGYEIPTPPDPIAFSRAKAAPLPDGYAGEEWPKMVNGILMQDPNGPVDNSHEYPKWVNDPDRERAMDILVNSRREENDARLKLGLEPLAMPKPPAPPDPVRDALVQLATAKGLIYDASWSNEQLEASLFRPTSPALAEAALGEAEKHVDPVPVPEPLPAAEAADRLQVIAELTRRGIIFDKRTPTRHLQSLLNSQAAE